MCLNNIIMKYMLEALKEITENEKITSSCLITFNPGPFII
jgi:hypothetical protein